MILERQLVPIGLDILDAALHQTLRFRMCVLLLRGEMSFTELREALLTTDGNLSVHADRLESCQYVETSKAFIDKKPKTTYRLTEMGEEALAKYIEEASALLDDGKCVLVITRSLRAAKN